MEAENAVAQQEAEKCAIIKAEVEEKKSSTEADLAAAGPLIEMAEAALNSIKKNDIQTAKAFANPPSGVPEVFAAAMYLMCGFHPDIDMDQKTRKPKSVDWKAAVKFMKAPEDLLKRLIEHKDIVKRNEIPP